MLASTAVIAETSPAAASTVAGTATIGIQPYTTAITVVATLQGATGGVLDVYIQTLINGLWYDWAHFTQLAAGAAVSTKVMHVTKHAAVASIAVGAPTATGATPTPALAAGNPNGGAWGSAFRAVYVAGASTSAGAAQSITFQFHREG